MMALAQTPIDINDGYLSAMSMHGKYTVWNAVRDNMIVGDSNNKRVKQHGCHHGCHHGQASCDPYSSCDPCEAVACDPCAPMTTHATHATKGAGQNVAWANYISRDDSYRSSYTKWSDRDWSLTMQGVQVGTDLLRTNRSQFGLLFGYESGRTVNAWDRVNANDRYAGLYAAHVFRGGADVRTSFGYGWQDYKMSRYEIHDRNFYTSSFKGYTTEGNLEIGKRLGRGPLSLRPVVGADLLYNNLKGAQESAGLYSLDYHKTNLTQVFIRAGSELRFVRRIFTFKGGAYYAYNVSDKDLKSGVNDPHANYGTGHETLLIGSKPGRSLLMFSLGGSCKLTQNLAIVGGYDGQLATDRNKDYHGIFHAGGSVKW